MPTVPKPLLNALKDVPGFDEAAFQEVHRSGAQVVSVRLNPGKAAAADSLFQNRMLGPNVPWSHHGYYLTQRPSFTFDPLFHAGCYYVQEASSMFLEQAILQAVDVSKPLNVLDLCAAPGGKSTHLQSLLSSESLLVSNEVIRSRAAILKQNIIKWGCQNVVVTNNDPHHFARLEGFFDVVVVDAPCSGSGLFRREPEAIAEWTPENVQLCCGRQKRILADVFPSLKEDGILIYATCSYSREEDEDIADWLAGVMHMENIRLHTEPEWHIVESTSEKSGAYGYRFFPDKVRGEGFYLSVFRRKGSTSAPRLKEAKLERATAAEKQAAQKWLEVDTLELFRTPYVYGLLKNLVPRYAVVKNALHVSYAGVAVGEVIRDKLLPEHSLALSTSVSSTLPAMTVPYETAIQYLQRNNLAIENEVKGWQLIRYQQHNIGWINALPNRINNYYPKDWRILKQFNATGFEK